MLADVCSDDCRHTVTVTNFIRRSVAATCCQKCRACARCTFMIWTVSAEMKHHRHEAT